MFLNQILLTEKNKSIYSQHINKYEIGARFQ